MKRRNFLQVLGVTPLVAGVKPTEKSVEQAPEPKHFRTRLVQDDPYTPRTACSTWVVTEASHDGVLWFEYHKPKQ